MEAGDMKFTIDPDLREIDFGQWEGMAFDEIPEGLSRGDGKVG